jgi:hypothetical protein
MSVDSLAPTRSRSSDAAPPDNSAAVAAGFVVLYLLLDWVSFVHPMRGTSITPWNPQAALAVALLAWQPRLGVGSNRSVCSGLHVKLGP